MRIRKSIGAIIVDNKNHFLLQRRKDQLGYSYWDILRGGIEKGEKPLDALKRELKEEVGITKVRKIMRMNMSYSFEFPEKMKKIINFDRQRVEIFFVDIEKEKIKVDQKEIQKAKFLNKEQFLKLATYETAKTALRKTLRKIKI
jgi:8-oxo-dGTP pyrophosphatase MutT (NUDIX family)